MSYLIKIPPFLYAALCFSYLKVISYTNIIFKKVLELAVLYI